ncbi:type VII secretion integral membrane protein EccD [Micromonospora sp. DT31]|uniref:type VII secretion integral membrane protein EccD n=1 Tax=Micromonospora sp. DT31 TaxID=3393434 RepID=UPI003CE909FF
MATHPGDGLVRLTISTLTRRIDLVLPERVPVAELAPALLRHLGTDDEHNGAGGGGPGAVGWSIRRSDGARLVTDQSLGDQGVRDGEVLRLVSRADDWPEPEYDDVVLAVSDGTSLLGTLWTGDRTRLASLTVGAVILLFGLPLLLTGHSWQLSALVAFIIALLAGVGGAVLSRVAGDSGAGGVVAAVSMPYAFLGGLVVLAGSQPLTDLSAPNVLIGCVALVLAATAGYFAVADLTWLFVAGAVAGLLGALGALLATLDVAVASAAAITAGVAMLMMPFATALSVWTAKLPMPDLPQTTEDLLRDQPPPQRERIFPAVVRTDEHFSGILLGLGVAVTCCSVLLVLDGGTAGRILAAVLVGLVFLRARSVAWPRQRTPLLANGMLALAVLAIGGGLSLDRAVVPLAVLAVVLPVAALVVFAGLRYARRRPGPRIARLADAAEFLLGASVVPIVAAVLGLFGYARGLGG